jgi:hypothetical protein
VLLWCELAWSAPGRFGLTMGGLRPGRPGILASVTHKSQNYQTIFFNDFSDKLLRSRNYVKINDVTSFAILTYGVRAAILRAAILDVNRAHCAFCERASAPGEADFYVQTTSLPPCGARAFQTKEFPQVSRFVNNAALNWTVPPRLNTHAMSSSAAYWQCGDGAPHRILAGPAGCRAGAANPGRRR